MNTTIDTSIDDQIAGCKLEIERLQYRIAHWACTRADALEWTRRIRELRVCIKQLEQERDAQLARQGTF